MGLAPIHSPRSVELTRPLYLHLNKNIRRLTLAYRSMHTGHQDRSQDLGTQVICHRPDLAIKAARSGGRPGEHFALLVERIGANAEGNVERRIPPEGVGRTERKDGRATAMEDNERA